MQRLIRHFAGMTVFLTGIALAQTAPKPLEFEVASIRPADPNARGSSLLIDRSATFNVTNLPLKALITFAYDIRDFQLSGGPGWTETERYNIVAKPERSESAAQTPDPRTITEEERQARDEQLRERVRSLLASRFGLVVHHETKEQTIYTLVVDRNGPKLKTVTVPGDRQGMSSDRGRSEGFAATTAMLARRLSNVTGRPVLDKTGLTGKYDFVLEWTPDIEVAHPETPEDVQPADRSGPTIFTALREQLGLRLEPAKGPVDIVVIDRADRPSAN